MGDHYGGGGYGDAYGYGGGKGGKGGKGGYQQPQYGGYQQNYQQQGYYQQQQGYPQQGYQGGYQQDAYQQQQQWQQPQQQQQWQQQQQQPQQQQQQPQQQQQQQPQQQQQAYQAPGRQQQQQQPAQQPQQAQPQHQQPRQAAASPAAGVQAQPQQQQAKPAAQGSKAVPGKLAPRTVGGGGGAALPGKLEPRKVENQFSKKGDSKSVKLPMPTQAKAATPAAAAPAPAAADKDAPKAKPKVMSLGGASKPKEEAKPAAAKDAPKEEKPKEEKKDAKAEKKEKPRAVRKEFKRDPRPHMNVVFIGHVDAGKSTISGNMMVLSGCVDDRTMEKYEREAKQKNREGWHLAYIMDLDEQEREKGKTHETGAGYFETETKRFTILDAPGHKAFVPSMIGGACQADVAVLVISARKGEFETGFDKGGQTREHALLVKTCGVAHLIVVVNKMDDPSVEYAQERYDEIVSKLTPFLKSTGFNSKQYQFLPVSGLKGDGLKRAFKKEDMPWYDGPFLQSALDKLVLPGRKVDDPVRFPVHGKYKDEGKLHVHGKLESGQLAVGDKVLIQPTKLMATIESIILEEHPQEAGFAGDQLILKLKGVDEEDMHTGFVLTDPQEALSNVQYFHAQVMILDVKSIISSGYTGSIMHIHSLAEEVTFNKLLATIDKKTNKIKEKYPKFVKGKDCVMVRMEVANPVCIEEYKVFDRMGRFMLRDEGKTIAVGVVTKLLDKLPEDKE